MASDTGPLPPPAPDPACCSCGCSRCSCATAWPRSVRRRVEMTVEDGAGASGICSDWVARVDVHIEAAALREALAGQHQTVSELCAELEEERAASASAASEAMAMILRLQREKAELQMEARQFKLFAEEKMAHDQQELLILEDLVYKREQAVQSLTCELRAYRHRLLSYGIDPDSLVPRDDDDGVETPLYDYPVYDYPTLRCYDNVGENGGKEDAELEGYLSGDGTDPCQDPLQNLERRIRQLERTPSQVSLVKEMVMGQPPRGRSRHARHLSADIVDSIPAKAPTFNGKLQEIPMSVDGLGDFGGEDDDETCDRVYTIDAVHCGPTPERLGGEHVSSPRITGYRVGGAEEADMQKLYARLRALEADRESMRQAIISMRTDKAQLVLLKEIAQQLYRDGSLDPPPQPEKKIVKKQTFFSRFSFMSAIKWVVSFVFGRRSTRRSKYTFGMSDRNIGLLLLLENSPQMRHWRCLSRIRY